VQLRLVGTTHDCYLEAVERAQRVVRALWVEHDEVVGVAADRVLGAAESALAAALPPWRPRVTADSQNWFAETKNSITRPSSTFDFGNMRTPAATAAAIKRVVLRGRRA
jgi:hypothetical protein